MQCESATYLEIQKWVQAHHGFVPETSWIVHVRELNGLPVRSAANRPSAERIESCPLEKRALIAQAFRHFGIL